MDRRHNNRETCARSRSRRRREDATREERRSRSRSRAPRPRHRSRSRHRSTSRRRSRSTVRCGSGGSRQHDQPRYIDGRTREPIPEAPILKLDRYGSWPNYWSCTATITDIKAGRWDTQTAFFVQVDLSIENCKMVREVSFSLWLVPVLADGTTELETSVKHYGPKSLKGELIVVHHTRESGVDLGLNAGAAGPTTLTAAGHANNTASYDMAVFGGLQTTGSLDGGRHKIFSQVYENKKRETGVPNNVRLYAVVVCPKAVALDVSAEAEVRWRMPKTDYLSGLSNPVVALGPWHEVALPEPQGQGEDYAASTSDDYRLKASNDCVTGNSAW